MDFYIIENIINHSGLLALLCQVNLQESKIYKGTLQPPLHLGLRWSRVHKADDKPMCHCASINTSYSEPLY